MTNFDKRRDAFESKFARDADMRFKAVARRNKLTGLWAAELLGLSDDQAHAYAHEVIKADLEEAGDEDVVRKISADFAAKGVAVTDDQIRVKLLDDLGVAIAEVEAGR